MPLTKPWAKGHDGAEKFLKVNKLTALVELPRPADVTFGSTRRARVAFLPDPGNNGALTVNGAAMAWAPANGVNFGGQYGAVDTIKVGQLIHIKVYGRAEIGDAMGQCPYADFHLQVLRDLAIIATFQSGQRLLRSIDTSGGGKILIKFCDGFTSTSQLDGIAWNPAMLPTFDGNPRGGAGNVFVQYNPALYGLPIMKGMDEPAYERGKWGHPAEKPPDVTLFHELVHADDCLNGVFDCGAVQRGRKAGMKLSEVRCVGLDEFRQAAYSENSFRAECNLVERDYYSDAVLELQAPLVPIVQSQAARDLLQWLGVHCPRTETSNEHVIPNLWEHRILHWTTFKAITDVWGKRNKIKTTDTGLKNLERIMGGVAQGKRVIHQVGQLERGQICAELKTIADETEAYLNLGSRQESGRVPGVRSLQIAACQQLILWGSACGQVNQYGAYVDKLAHKHVRDVDGNSPVGLAAENQASADLLRWLINTKSFDPNNRSRGLLPLDWARMKGLIGLEKVFAAKGGVRSDAADTVVLGGTAKADYIDALVAGTVMDPRMGMNARTAWTHLWDGNAGILQPLLKMAAHAMASGSRLTAAANDQTPPLRVVISPDAGSVAHASNHVVTVLRYSTDTATEGGLIHEVTHYLSLLLYDNNMMPFAKTQQPDEGQAYLEALAKDCIRAGSMMTPFLQPFVQGQNIAEVDNTKNIMLALPTALNADELVTHTNLQRLVFTLVKRLEGYVAKPPLFRQFAVPVIQEGIVSVPQAIHAYGDRTDVSNHAPNLLAYFEGAFMADIRSWLFNKLNPVQVQRPRRLSIGSSVPHGLREERDGRRRGGSFG